ncbi:MAG: SDR family NAD(P)-dependent oxidoreductase, partial [Sphingomonadaceae bacterium]
MLEGHVALVTGAAGGIGLAAARALRRDGAQVMLADIDNERLAAAA